MKSAPQSGSVFGPAVIRASTAQEFSQSLFAGLNSVSTLQATYSHILLNQALSAQLNRNLAEKPASVEAPFTTAVRSYKVESAGAAPAPRTAEPEVAPPSALPPTPVEVAPPSALPPTPVEVQPAPAVQPVVEVRIAASGTVTSAVVNDPSKAAGSGRDESATSPAKAIETAVTTAVKPQPTVMEAPAPTVAEAPKPAVTEAPAPVPQTSAAAPAQEVRKANAADLEVLARAVAAYAEAARKQDDGPQGNANGQDKSGKKAKKA
jgi:ribonuclease E